MSDQRANMFSELEEEARSEEESSMGNSTRDFFVDEEESTLLESHEGPGTLAKGPGVSIFNFSEPIGSSEGWEKEKVKVRTAVVKEFCNL